MKNKIKLMRNLMSEKANYNWGFCYTRNDKKTEATFKKDFPIAYQKITNGETEITAKDMESN